MMGEQYKPMICRDNDVVAFGEDTFKIGKFKRAVQECFGYDFGYGLLSLLGNQGIKIDKKIISPEGDKADYLEWFTEGIDCEILKTDLPGWHKAKVRIKVEVEFCVEESFPDHPLRQPQPPEPFEDTDATIHTDVWSETA